MFFIKVSFAFLGRMFISLIFILSAIAKIWDWQKTEETLVDLSSKMMSRFSSHDVFFQVFSTMFSSVTVVLAIIVFLELVGGILVFLGIKVRLGAFLLIVFLIPTTIIMHPFWESPENERMFQIIIFLKNISILGGLITLMVFGKVSDKSASKES